MKALINLYWNLDRPEVWQNSYYGPCPLEKDYFTPNKTEDPSVLAAGISYNYVKVKPKKCSELQRRKKVQGPKRVVGLQKVFTGIKKGSWALKGFKGPKKAQGPQEGFRGPIRNQGPEKGLRDPKRVQEPKKDSGA